MDIKYVLTLILGLAFFIFGMRSFSSNLEKSAGGRLEETLKKATEKPISGIVLGAAITVAVQSSSVVMVILVGLVSSGIIKFSETFYVIFGANIGTTLTAWVLSLSGIHGDGSVSAVFMPRNFVPLLAALGVILLMFYKNEKKQNAGTIMLCFAILMQGMELMKYALLPLSDSAEFVKLLENFNNPLVGLPVGAMLTVAFQSSAASIALLQAFTLTGEITYSMAIPIVLGLNIGTCITSVISCAGAGSGAKRVSALHITINTCGAGIVLLIYIAVSHFFDVPILGNFVSPLSVALIHTAFNLFITLSLAPFSKFLIKFTEYCVKDETSAPPPAFTLDERLLQSPSVAINECDSFTLTMADKAYSALKNSISLLFDYDESKVSAIKKTEKELDMLEDSLGSYLVKLSSFALSREDSRKISKMLHTIGDFERIGDHAVNIMETAKELRDKGLAFSNKGLEELKLLTSAIEEILDITFSAYRENNAVTAAKVEPLEQVVDHLKAQIKNNHIDRLQTGGCTIKLGLMFSDLLTDFERISDLCSNIAVAVIELIRGSFDTHKYLSAVKKGSDDFFKEYRNFSEKYNI